MTYPVTPGYVSGSATSQAAAAKVNAATKRAKVLAFIESRGAYGATDDEIQQTLGMHPSTSRPRRVELERMGMVRKTAMKRKTRSGREAAVYERACLAPAPAPAPTPAPNPVATGQLRLRL